MVPPHAERRRSRRTDFGHGYIPAAILTDERRLIGVYGAICARRDPHKGRHGCWHQADLFDQGYSTERMGPRFRLDADGRLVGDDPCPAADLSGFGAWRIDGDGRNHRRHRGGDRLHYKNILRRALGLARQAQMACGRRLRSGGFHQAGLSAGANHRLAGGGAFRRPDRQGHSRRPARRAGGGPVAGRSARREFWLAPIARHNRRLHRPPARHRPDVVDIRQLQGGVLVCRDSRLPGAGADRLRHT